jgi:hypothetical protein
MKFKDPNHPTEEELREWAADPESISPSPAWELLLSWGMEPGLLRVCVDLASDPDNMHRGLFRMVLYQWVETIQKGAEFEAYRTIYEGWLDALKGLTNPAIKRWRYEARRIIQGVRPFDRDRWWAECYSDERIDEC